MSPASDSSLRFLSQWRNCSLLSRISMMSSSGLLPACSRFISSTPRFASLRSLLQTQKQLGDNLCAGRDNTSGAQKHVQLVHARARERLTGWIWTEKRRCCCCRSSPLWFLCRFLKSFSVLFSFLLLSRPDTQECVGGVKLARRQEITEKKCPKNSINISLTTLQTVTVREK